MTATTEPQKPEPTLQEQIDTRRREIQTDGYPMSVGELVNLYRDNELDIHPEFQRFFRWSPKQKSRFIESLLLGIPIPSIFVYQRRDGVWDVIDGLQRLSTIFEFMGQLKTDDGDLHPSSTLVGTDYLPGLDGVVWEGAEGQVALDANQQRLIKRAAIDIKIVRRESDESTKFDLFERLNTGGSQLSDQEVRNCLLIMARPEYYRWVMSLRNNESFQATIAVSDRAASEQYDVELALRFMLIKDLDDAGLREIGDMNDFLNQAALAEAYAEADAVMGASESFKRTFALIDDAVGEAAFRRYDPAKQRFLGGFSVSAFEAVTSGIYTNVDAWEATPQEVRADRLLELLQSMWSDAEFRENSGSGIRASSRIPKVIPYGRHHFVP